MICPKADCEERDQCPHGRPHEKTDECVAATVVCPDCVEEGEKK